MKREDVFPTIFIDTEGYDEYEPLDYPDYIGISEFDVYEVPVELSEDDQDSIDYHYSSRESYPKMGKAIIGFIDFNDYEIVRSNVAGEIQIFLIY